MVLQNGKKVRYFADWKKIYTLVKLYPTCKAAKDPSLQKKKRKRKSQLRSASI
jgi:hypothetical protein